MRGDGSHRAAAGAAHRCRRVDDVPGFGWAALGRQAAGDAAGDASTEHDDDQRPRHRRGRPEPTARSRSTASPASTAWSTTATTATRTTTRRPTTTRSSTRRSAVDRRVARGRPGAGRASRSSARSTRGPSASTTPNGGASGTLATSGRHHRSSSSSAGERLVRVTTTFDNPSRDHRLRARFPLPEAATVVTRRVRVRRSSSAASTPRAAHGARPCRRSRRGASCRPAA